MMKEEAKRRQEEEEDQAKGPERAEASSIVLPSFPERGPSGAQAKAPQHPEQRAPGEDRQGMGRDAQGGERCLCIPSCVVLS